MDTIGVLVNDKILIKPLKRKGGIEEFLHY